MTKSRFSEEYDYFRQQLVEARRVAGFTQAEVAARLEKPQSYVSKYEQGERRLDVVEFARVAKVLDIDVPAFIGRLQQLTDRE